MDDLIIIGAGASGLMAAIAAARNGLTVTILEQNKRPGRKLLATGNGKCNLTNTSDPSKAYRGEDPTFALRVLEHFSVEDTLAFFHDLGLLTVSHNGWIYPYSEQSQTVLKLLLRECDRLGVRIRTDTKVTGLRVVKAGSDCSEENSSEETGAPCAGPRFHVDTSGWTYETRSVILACGSPASEVTGSSDSGYKMAAGLGHTLISPCPALTSLASDDPRITRWGGTRAYASVTLITDSQPVITRSGQLQLNDRSLSGIPVFQISRFAARALAAGKKTSIEVDFMPDMSEERLIDFFEERLGKEESRSGIKGAVLGEALTGLFPEKLIDVFLMYAHSPQRLAAAIKHFRLAVSGTASLKHAQVAAGGIATGETDPATMASKLVPGLYLTGELLDIDGDCGGWNLQFAWSTGYLAGQAASEGKSK